MTQRLVHTLLLLLLAVSHLVPHTEAALGGEKAYFTTPQMAPNVTHRQNVCDRFDAFRLGEVELKDALEGLQLNVLMLNYQGGYFNYNNNTGIDATYPGIMPVLLDELARRGKFTWRESFGVSGAPKDGDWTGLLKWGVESFDVNADWWAPNLPRMNMGINFLEDWYDSSIILIKKETPEVISDDINFWNWLRPYDRYVWLCTIVTILLSGLVFQWLEWFDGARDERTTWEWFSENLYLSAINFTQAYEYQPKSLSARIFGVSMAIWALVMTATYTANLASLLVERKPTAIQVETIEEASAFGYKICTFDGTNSDTHIKTNFAKAERIPKTTLEDVYRGLNSGECAFAADVVTSWNELSKQKKYNPDCDLQWLGGDRLVAENGAGFGVNADSGQFCSGLIRDVLDFHMKDLKMDGFLDDAWDREYRRKQDRDCNTWRPELEALESLAAEEEEGEQEQAGLATEEDPSTRRRQLFSWNRNAAPSKDNESIPSHKYRLLKAGGKGAAGGAVAAAAAADSDPSSQKLSLNQMIGTFAFHWVMMFIALVIAHFKYFYGKHAKPHVVQLASSVTQHMSTHVLANRQKEEGLRVTVEMEETAQVQGDNVADMMECNDKFNNNENSNFSSQKMSKMQEQLESLQQSQQRMSETQQQLLEEQKSLQQQIRLLVDAINIKC